MSKCRNCGIVLRDKSQVCPLCRCIVEQEEPGISGDELYPHLEKKIKKMQRAFGIYVLAAIVCELILAGVNYMLGGMPWWVFMTGIFLIYTGVTLKCSIEMHTGYRLKMFLQTILGIWVIIALDYFLGFQRWSLNYVLPAAFVLLDIAIVILMIVNNRNWQSYMPMQLFIIALTIVPIVLYQYGITNNWICGGIAFCISVLIFVGTLLIGGKRARDELYRRFHA